MRCDTGAVDSPSAQNMAFWAMDVALGRPLSAHASRQHAVTSEPAAPAECMALLYCLGAPAMRLCTLIERCWLRCTR